VRLGRSKAGKIAGLTRRWAEKNKSRRLVDLGLFLVDRILGPDMRADHARNPPAVTMSPWSIVRRFTSTTICGKRFASASAQI
jgi:hypothetical protein